jgi:hypothetical protein
MRAKVGLGIVAATLVTFGLIACNSLFCQSPAAEPPPPVPQAGPVVIRFTTCVKPIFEGGAIGQPVPLTVEIRMDARWKEARISPELWQKNLPDKVKEAVEVALAEAAGEDPPADRRRDQVLDRLDKIERRLKQIERKTSGK